MAIRQLINRLMWRLDPWTTSPDTTGGGTDRHLAAHGAGGRRPLAAAARLRAGRLIAQQKQRVKNQARDQMALSLNRWEGEGGTLSQQWHLKYERSPLGIRERRILECLGAAMVSGWHELPTQVQRDIFQRATSSQADDPIWLKSQIARFLHDNKDKVISS